MVDVVIKIIQWAYSSKERGSLVTVILVLAILLAIDGFYGYQQDQLLKDIKGAIYSEIKEDILSNPPELGIVLESVGNALIEERLFRASTSTRIKIEGLTAVSFQYDRNRKAFTPVASTSQYTFLAGGIRSVLITDIPFAYSELEGGGCYRRFGLDQKILPQSIAGEGSEIVAVPYLWVDDSLLGFLVVIVEPPITTKAGRGFLTEKSVNQLTEACGALANLTSEIVSFYALSQVGVILE